MPGQKRNSNARTVEVKEYIGSCKRKEMTGYGSKEMEMEKPMSTRREEEK